MPHGVVSTLTQKMPFHSIAAVSMSVQQLTAVPAELSLLAVGRHQQRPAVAVRLSRGLSCELTSSGAGVRCGADRR
jgi:hypothetical protein